jgi:hypothetical protein
LAWRGWFPRGILRGCDGVGQKSHDGDCRLPFLSGRFPGGLKLSISGGCDGERGLSHARCLDASNLIMSEVIPRFSVSWLHSVSGLTPCCWLRLKTSVYVVMFGLSRAYAATPSCLGRSARLESSTPRHAVADDARVHLNGEHPQTGRWSDNLDSPHSRRCSTPSPSHSIRSHLR